MYKEVAIDPECMVDYLYYVLIKREFGFEQGRYISADARQWAQEAIRIVKDSDMHTIKKQSVKNFINRIGRGRESGKFILAVDRKNITGVDWNNWWEYQMAHRPFSISVSENGLPHTINHDNILDNCQEWKVHPSLSVEKNAQDIISPMETLIYMSKEVLLVDQYFKFTDNCTLIELFKLISKSSITMFKVVTSMETLNAKNIYDREYKHLNTKSIPFEWIKAPPKYFHDRYIVTDVGAVKAGQGFTPDIEKGVHADKLNINLVSLDEAQGIKSSLDEALKNNVASIVFSTNK